MNINWPNIKAAASASGNVLNTSEVKTSESEKDFKAMFASQLMQMWQDYRETGLTAGEQLLKAAGGEEALQAKEDLKESGSALFTEEKDAEDGSGSKSTIADTEIIRKYMPDGTILILTYQDGKITDQRRVKPMLTEKPDYSKPPIVKNGEEEYQTKLVPKRNLFENIM